MLNFGRKIYINIYIWQKIFSWPQWSSTVCIITFELSSKNDQDLGELPKIHFVMPSIGFWPSKVLNRKILWQLVWLLKVTTAGACVSQTRKKGNLPLRLLRLMRWLPRRWVHGAPQHFMINFNAKRLIGLLPLSSNYNIVLGNHLKVSFYFEEYFQSVDVV